MNTETAEQKTEREALEQDRALNEAKRNGVYDSLIDNLALNLQLQHQD